MPTAQITSLITTPDNTELVRDQIAAILLVESTQQQVLATAQSLDPTPWKLRIFTERSNPWAEFVDPPDPETANIDRTPIVNVSFDNWTTDMSMGNAVSRQQVAASFNVDVYGYGSSYSDGGTGHIPGDERAAFEAQRGARLARQILMAGAYTYLGMQGVVGRRWPQSLTMLQTSTGDHPVQHVVAARFVLQASLNEFSPQVEGVPLALLSLQVLRKETGQLLLRTNFPE